MSKRPKSSARSPRPSATCNPALRPASPSPAMRASGIMKTLAALILILALAACGREPGCRDQDAGPSQTALQCSD